MNTREMGVGPEMHDDLPNDLLKLLSFIILSSFAPKILDETIQYLSSFNDNSKKFSNVTDKEKQELHLGLSSRPVIAGNPFLIYPRASLRSSKSQENVLHSMSYPANKKTTLGVKSVQ